MARFLRCCALFVLFVSATSVGLLSLVGSASANPMPTTVALTSSANPSVSGQPVVFTATVSTVPPGGTPTGNVQFAFTTRVVCAGGSNTIALASGSAQCSTAGMPSAYSPVTATATFEGSAGFGASAPATLSQTVDAASATVTVTSANNPPGGTGSGKPNRFTATIAAVSPSLAQPTGTVAWTIASADGTTSIACSNGSPTKVNVSGLSKCTVPVDQLTAAGSPWTVSAAYSGDADFSPASSALPGGQLVHQATTSSYITASPNPVERGSPLNVTASVVAPKFAGTPTGTMTFAFTGTGAPTVTCQGGSDTVALTSTSATCSLPSGLAFSGSPYHVVATYSGDANDMGSATDVRGGTARAPLTIKVD